MEIIALVRLINAALASIIFAFMINRGMRRVSNDEYTKQEKLLYLMFFMYTFVAAYGSVEAYASRAELGLRVWMLLIANLVGVYAFVFVKQEVRKVLPKDSE